MTQRTVEIYRPRQVADLGIWDVGVLRLKVYGITARGQLLSDEVVGEARAFAHRDVPGLVAAEGADNGLGFVIIHAGELGVSVLVHWWIQGSVLCQHIQRRVWDSDVPMDTATRPVIACVWELGLINAEQEVWRETMMTAQPDAEAYMSARASLDAV